MIGFAPQQVDAMSVWEFGACVDGWKASKGIRTTRDISDARLAEMGIVGFG